MQQSGKETYETVIKNKLWWVMICLVLIGVARVARGRVTTSLDIWEDILKKKLMFNWNQKGKEELTRETWFQAKEVTSKKDYRLERFNILKELKKLGISGL